MKTSQPDVHERMRAEWNERAREDAHYFVAFGRRDQDDEEFFATGADLVRELETELKRLPPAPPELRRALEIGCGPGRLMRPMSRHFGEIHGVDISDEMIAKARRKLAGVPHAHPHHASGSDLSLFADNWFDFVYSYAVFQHIPSAEVVLSYLRETARVLKPGGVARLQINGLPKTSKAFTTWEGVRVGADEVHALARELGVRLLSLTGVGTQYMWTTWQKPTGQVCRIRAISNAFSSEQAVPASGRNACAALSIEGLPEDCDLNSMEVRIDGAPGVVCYIGPRAGNCLTQVNVFLPRGVRTGLVPVRVDWNGAPLCPERYVRVIPPGPAVPRLTALSDGVNLLSPQHIESGLMKATIEEVDDVETFAASVDGIPVQGIETFRTDPLAERWEVNFAVPAQTKKGGHVLEVRLGRRLLARTGIVTALLTASLTAADTPEAMLRRALLTKTGAVTLPAGVIEISREVTLPVDAHDLEIRGNGTTIRAAGAFRGRALLVVPAGKNIKIHDLKLDGNRDAVGRMMALPPAGVMFSRVLPANGILSEGVTGLDIGRIQASHVSGFAILINSSHNVRLQEVEITESGGLNPQRRNNGTGGIALEEGTSDFEIGQCRFGGIRGNGITLRGVSGGRIARNEFALIAGDAIQADGSSGVVIENNSARQVGFPADEAGDQSVCLRLERSSQGDVKSNTCSETRSGAIVVSGANNRITGNHLTELNVVHGDSAGIYLESGARDNAIGSNEISGFGMGNHCIGAAPDVPRAANRIGRNECTDEASLAALF